MRPDASILRRYSEARERFRPGGFSLSTWRLAPGQPWAPALTPAPELAADVRLCASSCTPDGLAGLLHQRLSGNTGATTRPKVELMTAANDVYQATIARTIPTYPPSLIVLLVAAVPPARAELPIPRMMNVIAQQEDERNRARRP